MTTFYRHPVDNPVITGRFGEWYNLPPRPPYQHRGIDYGTSMGTPVYAPCPARVAWYSNPAGDFGVAVCLALDNGWYTLFAHLSQKVVGEGQSVETGQLLGYSGNTGASQAPHLHWQYSNSPYFPVDITQNRDPLLELDENMMSPEERQRVENLERLFGGQYAVASMVGMGIDLKMQIDQQNTAIFGRINEHRADGHGLPVYP